MIAKKDAVVSLGKCLCFKHFLGPMLKREQNYDKHWHVFFHVIDNIECLPLIYEYTIQ